MSTHTLWKAHSEKEKLVLYRLHFYQGFRERKHLNVYVFIGNVSQTHTKRSYLFTLLKSTLCNIPQGQVQPEEKGHLVHK